jgi:glyoxylase-like metal-dependent hydrolase (beta-lactamase superfamily II)
MIRLKTFVFNPFYENTYVIWDISGKEAMIVDPGCYDDNEEMKLAGFIEQNGLNVKYIINSHCHIDHIFGNAFTKEKYTAELLIPEKDQFLLNIMIGQAKSYGVELRLSPKPDGYIEEDKILRLGETEVNFIFTPGHSPGEFCILFEKDKICLTGDVLFKEGIGRSDLWGADQRDLFASIRNKLFKLDDDIIIYPGHGESSTIGHEKVYNPFL